MIGATDQFAELVHGFLDDARHGGVIRINRFTGLEEYIRVLGRAAQDRVFGRHGTGAMSPDKFIVQHGAQIVII